MSSVRAVFYRSDDGESVLYLDEIELMVNSGDLSTGKIPFVLPREGEKIGRYTHCAIADSGFGCVRLVVAGAKLELALIVSGRAAAAPSAALRRTTARRSRAACAWRCAKKAAGTTTATAFRCTSRSVKSCGRSRAARGQQAPRKRARELGWGWRSELQLLLMCIASIT